MSHSTQDKEGNVKSMNRSHSMKRHSVQKLQEHLPPHSFVDRCGFVMKNMHTMFEYFINSETQDHKSGLALANWLHVIDGIVQGGIPPCISAIKTASGKVQVFVNTLFRT